MSSPPRPPYGELIEQARLDAGLSKREAARRAGISDAWWRYVTEGHQGSTAVPGTADTVAAMARAVGLSPERLEEGGQRKDAADALRAMLRSPARPEPPREAAFGVIPSEKAQALFPGDLTKQLIYDAGEGDGDELTTELMKVVNEFRTGRRSRREGTALPPVCALLAAKIPVSGHAYPHHRLAPGALAMPPGP